MFQSKEFGCMLMFAGTCIGAGMLALPLSTAGSGFILSSFILVFAACTCVVTSLLILEAVTKSPDNLRNLSSISEFSLGKVGKITCSISYLVLLFSLSCAYVSGATSMIQANLHVLDTTCHTTLINCIYICVIAMVVHQGHRVVDISNRILFSLKALCFFALIILLLGSIQWALLLDLNIDWTLSVNAIPVLFFSFGLQIVVPTVFYYLDRDIARTRRCILLGSLIPFIVYLVWLVFTLGLLPRYGNPSFANFLSSHSANNIGDFFFYINKQNPLTTLLLIAFAHTAIATSYATVSLSLRDFIQDAFKLSHTTKGQCAATLLTYLPTLLLVTLAQNVFQQALNFSAAVITIVLIFVPIAMVTVIRKRNISGGYTAAGGTMFHGLLAVIGAMLFVAGLMASFGYLPTLSQ